jgi:hypothetical protein
VEQCGHLFHHGCFAANNHVCPCGAKFPTLPRKPFKKTRPVARTAPHRPVSDSFKENVPDASHVQEREKEDEQEELVDSKNPENAPCNDSRRDDSRYDDDRYESCDMEEGESTTRFDRFNRRDDDDQVNTVTNDDVVDDNGL